MRIIATAAVIGLLLSPSALARPGAPPSSGSLDVVALEQVPVLKLPAPDVETLKAEDARRRESGRPGALRFAAPADVLITPLTHGAWEELADGGRLWRLRVFSPGATDLNFGFTRYRLPEGATLHVVAEDGGYHEGPFTAADNAEHGELWTPVVPGDRAWLELRLPPRKSSSARETFELELGRVSHGYRDVFGLDPRPRPKAGACNNDVICAEADPWRNEIQSVGWYTLQGFDTCTGSLVMDVPGTFTPWFLTAEHCGIDAGNDQTIVVYWNYESPTCGQLGGGSLAQNQAGATLRSARVASDFALVELDADPLPAFNPYFAGWDRSDTPPATSVTIHHPSLDEKAITFNDDPLTFADNCIGPEVNTHWEANWEDGTTEGGSSGAGIWDAASHLIVGTLSGGFAACGNDEFDCYGRFALHWDGPSADQRLRDWLDPANTMATTRQGAYPGSVIAYVSHAGVDNCSVGSTGGNGSWDPGETIDLTVTIQSSDMIMDVEGTLSSSTPGVSIGGNPVSWGVVPAATATAGPTAFRVTLDPSMACPALVEFELEIRSAGNAPRMLAFSQLIGARPEVPLAIMDSATVTSALDVLDDVVLTDLDVRVEIDHMWVGDITLVLRSPSGRMATLLAQPGIPNVDVFGCGDQDMNVTFDDESATTAAELDDICTLMLATPWYVGDAQPVDALSVFDGDRSLGQWELMVSDAEDLDTGTLLDWELIATPPIGSCPTCADVACPGQAFADVDVRVVKGAAGSVVLTFPNAPSPCAVGEQVRMATTPRPASGDGMFPLDPSFANVTGEDLDAGPAFQHAPPPGTVYYLVVEDLRGGAAGPSGHYGN